MLYLFCIFVVQKKKKKSFLLYTKTKKYGQLTQDSKKPPLFSTWTKFFHKVPKKPFTAGGYMLSIFCIFVVKNKKKLASLIYKNKKIWTTDTRFKKTTPFFNLDENFFTRYLKNLLPPEAPCFLFFCIFVVQK